MHINQIDPSNLIHHKFYHLYAKYDNKDMTIDKELLIVIVGHAISYQVQSFGSMVKQTTDFEIAAEYYNQLGE